MRIISGTHKGRRLIAPKTLPVRPTTDFAKEALFNILRNTLYFNEISVLDLFSGTGNISYEFASRGTEKIVAVDAHHDCVKYIKKTAEELEFPIETVKSDVVKYLSAILKSFVNMEAQCSVFFSNKAYVVPKPCLTRIRFLYA